LLSNGSAESSGDISNLPAHALILGKYFPNRRLHQFYYLVGDAVVGVAQCEDYYLLLLA